MIIEMLPKSVFSSLNAQILSKTGIVKEVVFDPQMTYTSSLELLRARNVMIGAPKTNAALPLLSWSRSSAVGYGLRKKRFSLNGNVRAVVEVSPVKIPYQCLIFCQSMSDYEKLEQAWNLSNGLRSITKGSVSLPFNYGQIDYSVVWSVDITSADFSLGTNYFKAIGVQADIYFTSMTIEDDMCVAVISNSGDVVGNAGYSDTNDFFDLREVLSSSTPYKTDASGAKFYRVQCGPEHRNNKFIESIELTIEDCLGDTTVSMIPEPPPVIPEPDDEDDEMPYTHSQPFPLAKWTVPHNMLRFPAVTVTDHLGNVVISDIEYIDNNTVQITHGVPFSGYAYFR